MNAAPAPDVKPPEGRRKWFTWRKISVFLVLLPGFLSYVAYSAKESWRVAAAHTGVAIISGQLQLFAARSAPEPLTCEAAVKLLKEDHRDVATDGSGRYNLMQIEDRFVIHTEVLREGFALKRVVVFGTPENAPEAVPEAEFMVRKKAGNL